MGEALVGGQRFLDQPDRFLEALRRFLQRDAEALELVRAIALADAEIEPAVRQHVHGRGLFGEQHGIVPGHDDHGGAEPDPAGSRGEIGQQVERGGNLRAAGEVMLDQEDAVEPQPLRLDDAVDQLPIAVAVLGLGKLQPLAGARGFGRGAVSSYFGGRTAK